MYKKTRYGAISIAAGLALYHLFSGKKESSEPVDKAIITQNSGLFTSYTYLFQNSILLENKELGKSVLIKQPFWLDEVNESRLNTPWGQNFREYPPIIQQKILKLFPGVEKQERLTFGQMKKLREHIASELKQSKEFDIIDGECADIKLGQSITEKFPLNEDHLFSFYPYRHGWKDLEKDNFTSPETSNPNLEVTTCIKIITKNNKTYDYEITNNFKLYNFAIEPRSNLLMKELSNGKDLPTQTELYKYKRGNEPKRIIVFGSGLSAVWVCEQAPESAVHIVMRDRSSQLPPEIKRNEKTKIDSKQLLYSNETDFLFLRQCWGKFESETNLQKSRKRSLAGYAKLHGIDLEQEKKNENFIVAFKKDSDEVLAIGVGYNAIGFVPNKSIGESLPNSMVEHVHFDFKKQIYGPKNIPGGALFDRHNEQLRHLVKHADPIAYIDIEALFIREEDKVFLAKKLDVHSDFIEYLCKEIKKLEDTPEDSKEFIKQHFMLWQQNKNTVNSKQVILNFNQKLDQLFEERNKYYPKQEQPKSFQPK